MKNTIFIIIAFITLTSCSEEQLTNPDSRNLINFEINKKSSIRTNDILLTKVLTSPNRHYYKFNKEFCFEPPFDCFPDVIVWGLTLPYIQELDSLISISEEYKFFQNEVITSICSPDYMDRPFMICKMVL